VAEAKKFKQIIDETCQLLRQKNNKKREITLSAETAQLIESVSNRKIVETAITAPTAHGAIPDLPSLEQTVSQCTACPLATTRTQTVFGSGSSTAKLVFVGEAPGHDEDVKGKPFVGRAGQLLTDIIEKGMKLKRSDVYICNVLKCRPPNNRDPLPAEVEQCEPYLIRQLEIIQPKVICALGTHAAQTLLKTDNTIGRLRGKWHFYHGIPLRATYHPAYLLRSPSEKKKTWADVKEIMKVYNGEVVPEP